MTDYNQIWDQVAATEQARIASEMDAMFAELTHASSNRNDWSAPVDPSDTICKSCGRPRSMHAEYDRDMSQMDQWSTYKDMPFFYPCWDEGKRVCDDFVA